MADKKTSDKGVGEETQAPAEDAKTSPDEADTPEVDQDMNDENVETGEADMTEDAPEGGNDETAEGEAAAEESVQEDDDNGDRPDEISAPPAPVTTEQVVIRKGGFFPLVLGGVAAALIGFGVARYVLPDWPFASDDQAGFQQDVEQRLQDQSAAIDGIESKLNAMPETPDAAGIETAQAEIMSRLDGVSDQVSQVTARLDDIDARLTEVEKRPVGEAASDAAVTAYERELKALQDSMAQQRAEIEAMAQDARAMEESAEETAQATMRRAALTRIQTALDTGTGFASAVADLEAAGASVPDALADVANSGVPTLGELQNSFPDAARRALAVSRQSTGEGAGVGGFLRDQLGIRSLTPREGDDPDAVLSRAEAATRDGRLQDALAEIEALPEAGRAELSDWAGQVALRLQAVSAAENLAQDMN